MAEPELADDIQARELDREVRAELRSLGKTASESVARRLVATGELLDVEPREALAHALVARRQASRIAAVREAVGIAAYHAGEWQLAIAELRAYHRMAGRQTHIAVLADCERALGRPERAIDMFRHAERKELGLAEWIELLIVASGARRDMGQVDASVTMLQVPELQSTGREPWLLRLVYAYAEALLAAGREEEAATWFERTVALDRRRGPTPRTPGHRDRRRPHRRPRRRR
jgi:tetratricopeptide (TPR) repeat protein